MIQTNSACWINSIALNDPLCIKSPDGLTIPLLCNSSFDFDFIVVSASYIQSSTFQKISIYFFLLEQGDF